MLRLTVLMSLVCVLCGCAMNPRSDPRVFYPEPPDNHGDDYFPIKRVVAEYPTEARIARVEGHVTVAFTITRFGFVEDVTVVESEPAGVFDQSAIGAVSQWQFKPRYVDGEPVSVPDGQTTVRFSLSSK